MTKEQEALKLALEAIEELRYSSSTFKSDKLSAEAITAIKEALAQPAQEPAAWMFQHEETGRTMCIDTQQLEWGFEKGNPRFKKIGPLYTASQQQPWVGLTDEEIRDCYKATYAVFQGRRLEVTFARAVEAKLKEKNERQ